MDKVWKRYGGNAAMTMRYLSLGFWAIEQRQALENGWGRDIGKGRGAW